ncbi:hypothetical protein [Methylobacterium sp.]|uniref:hypothetical protein n=1 Tax=Methylobacterium sp. TaxID=409 RepID=UPI0025F47365|nr:hypothetical protein [Methylobacterium sp.]MBY0260139.1 hypothetical protein [Methylobacterium sp.]
MSSKLSEINPARGGPVRSQPLKPRKDSVERLTVKKPAAERAEGRTVIWVGKDKILVLKVKQKRFITYKLKRDGTMEALGSRLIDPVQFKSALNRGIRNHKDVVLYQKIERLDDTIVVGDATEKPESLSKSPLLAAAKARLDALTPGFTDWIDRLPPLPEDEFGVGGGDLEGPFVIPERKIPKN